jgi:hypothetical protein
MGERSGAPLLSEGARTPPEVGKKERSEEKIQKFLLFSKTGGIIAAFHNF